MKKERHEPTSPPPPKFELAVEHSLRTFVLPDDRTSSAWADFQLAEPQSRRGRIPSRGDGAGSQWKLLCTAIAGGAGYGTIFEVTPDGALTPLHVFCAQTCADGAVPYASLIQANNGDLYGTTLQGGKRSGSAHDGSGTVFKITTGGDLTTLHNFCAQSGCPDGSMPIGALIQASDAEFYGTTSTGGANDNGGTIFRMSPNGELTTLYSFCSQSNCADGAHPNGNLAQDAAGNFYGTTVTGA